jgi:hypothetical protein
MYPTKYKYLAVAYITVDRMPITTYDIGKMSQKDCDLIFSWIQRQV